MKGIDILRSRDKCRQFNFLPFQYRAARDILRCHSEHTAFADKSVSLVYIRNGYENYALLQFYAFYGISEAYIDSVRCFILYLCLLGTLSMIKLLSGVISALENVIYPVIRNVTKSVLLCNRGLFINW